MHTLSNKLIVEHLWNSTDEHYKIVDYILTLFHTVFYYHSIYILHVQRGMNICLEMFVQS